MDKHNTSPGFKIQWVRYTFKLASNWLPPQQHYWIERWLVCVEGRGRISRSGLTQDIKMGNYVFECDVSHKWIAQRQVGPVSVYCDGVGVWCSVSAAWHSCVAAHWTITTSRHRRGIVWPQMLKSDDQPKQTNELNCKLDTSNPDNISNFQTNRQSTHWKKNTEVLSGFHHKSFKKQNM